MTDFEQMSGCQHQVVQALQREVEGLQCAGAQDSWSQNTAVGMKAQGRDEKLVSSGCESLDQLLPSNGFRRGTLTEWLSDQPGSGAETLSLIA